MRRPFAVVSLLVALPLCVGAGEPEKKPNFDELSRLLHRMALKQVPREHEQTFGWGQTIPIPDKLRLPALRTYVKVDGRLELPHGAWRRARVKLLDPARDLRIKVRDFRPAGKGYRLVIDAEADLFCEGEWRQWQKGLLLVAQVAEADAHLAASIVCDVDVSFDTNKFPPAVKVEPKITDLTVDLKDFTLRRVGGTVEGEKVRELGTNLMRDVLRDLVKASEPLVKDYANDAIARSLREGKGGLPLSEILQALPKTPPAKEKK